MACSLAEGGGCTLVEIHLSLFSFHFLRNRFEKRNTLLTLFYYRIFPDLFRIKCNHRQKKQLISLH